MARPAIVIGLGETGQWVLTFLKKDLMESNDGVIPADVQLLAVDTQLSDVNHLKAGSHADNDSRVGQLKDIRAGHVGLDPIKEFFQLEEPSYDLFKKIHLEDPRSEEYKWLDTEDLIKLDPTDWQALATSETNRQLGRLSLFSKVIPFYNKIQQAISTGINVASNKLTNYGDYRESQKERLEIVIVTSLADGTGGGIFMDVAWLVRAAAKSLIAENYCLTAYLVMPTAWEQQGPDTGKRLRAYAAWQELNRYMLPPTTRYYEKIKYLPNAIPPIEAEYDRRIFDVAYIIDPGPPAQNLSAMRPENGTFPVVAQAISGLLDDHMGQMLSLVNSNDSTIVGTLPRGSYYSSVGAFTFKTSERFSRQQILNEYKLAVLEHFIAPDFGPARQVIGIRHDYNTEVKPPAVGYGASSFLSSIQHNMINNNALLPEIEKVSTNEENLAKYIVEEANEVVNLAGETFKALVTKVNNPELQEKLEHAMSENIWHVVVPSSDRADVTPGDIKQELLNGVNDTELEWFGQWDNTPDLKNPNTLTLTRKTEGSKVRLLHEAADAIINNYKALLKEWSANQLNGTDSNPAVAKSGKLGYLIAVYENLDRKFGVYINYLERLKNKISENETRIKLADARDAARKTYDTYVGKECIFTFFDNNVHPRAREAERGFLLAADKLFKYYLSEAVIESLFRAVRAIQEFTRKSKEELEKWVVSLVIGRRDGDPNERFKSLYSFSWDILWATANSLHAEITHANLGFDENRKLTGVQQVLGVDLANEHYQAIDRMTTFNRSDTKFVPYQLAPEIEAGLDTLVWNVKQSDEDESLEFGLGILGSNGNVQPFILDHTDKVTQENYTILSRGLEGVFNTHFDKKGMYSATPIVNILAREFPDTNQLARDLRKLSSPLYQQRQGGQIVYEQNSMFMRLNASANNAFFMELERSIQEQFTSSHDGVNLFNNREKYETTSDPYKFTFLQFHHAIPSKDFILLYQMENLFQTTMMQPNQVVSPSTYYVQHAEKIAYHYAMRRVQLKRMNFQNFELEIVALLNHPERLKLFFLAYAQGLLTFTDGAGVTNTKWELHGNDVMNGVTLFDKILSNDDVARNPTVYEILHLWLNGRDANPEREHVITIDWEKLNQLILDQEHSSLQETILASYRKHMDEDESDSLVSLIRKQATNRRHAVMIENRRFYQDKMFDDLIDLVKVFYLERLEIYAHAQKRADN